MWRGPPLPTWFPLRGFSSSAPSAPPAWFAQLPAPSTLVCSIMAITVYLSCLLVLSMAGLAQGIKSSLRSQVSAPHLLPIPFLPQIPCLGFTLSETTASFPFLRGEQLRLEK